MKHGSLIPGMDELINYLQKLEIENKSLKKTINDLSKDNRNTLCPNCTETKILNGKIVDYEKKINLYESYLAIINNELSSNNEDNKKIFKLQQILN